MTEFAPDEAAIREALREVIDPEVGVNIVDLGLVYRVEITDDRIAVDMTMTSPACPMGDMIADEVKAVLEKSAPAGRLAEVRLVWEPPWDPAMMSEAARRHFAG